LRLKRTDVFFQTVESFRTELIAFVGFLLESVDQVAKYAQFRLNALRRGGGTGGTRVQTRDLRDAGPTSGRIAPAHDQLICVQAKLQTEAEGEQQRRRERTEAHSDAAPAPHPSHLPLGQRAMNLWYIHGDAWNGGIVEQAANAGQRLILAAASGTSGDMFP
jgi:hypothetical protein